MQTAKLNETTGSMPGLKSLNETLTGKSVLCVAASAFVALCAHVSVPLPFTPVPLTLSNFAVILVGLALGPATAFAAMLLYLGEGAVGLPVFAPGGPLGMAHLLGPTGGFLFAYPLAAAIAGSTYRALSRRQFAFNAAVVACSLATIVILLFGASWLATLLHLSPGTAFKSAVAPFLPGEVVKIAAAAGIFTSLRSWQRN